MTAPHSENDQGELICDFAAIGIPHVDGAFAVRLEHNELAEFGMCSGDIVLFDPGEPKAGDVVAVERGGVLEICVCRALDVPHVTGIARGLIRRL